MLTLFKKMRSLYTGTYVNVYALVFIVSVGLLIQACNSSQGNASVAMAPQSLPVIAVKNTPATLYREFSASLEGKKDIEIRAQVNGYLDKIYVDEGAHVKKGQLLFLINDRPYREQYNAANASLAAAKAGLANAQINVSKISPLVKSNVVSEVQLKGAEASYNVAASSVEQAKAMVANAAISLSYTAIKAPADGYIGRIPYKIGSLVGITSAEALTLLSEIKEIYAYFSLSEKDFLQFRNQFSGATIEDKIKQLPPVPAQ
ncbi:MAG: efflux RND transporter periplasmic adaptor subunit, partial [Flavitalea sp.]